MTPMRRTGLMRRIGRWLAGFLSQPIKGFMPLSTSDPGAFARTLRPADVLLVEGSTRISTAIKYLTQSTWSHSALYVGPLSGRCEPSGEPHVLIEADLLHGVISVPLSKYAGAHMRICRPVGLGEADARAVTDFATQRLGAEYDLKNVLDLLRYFLPTPPVPSRFRRRLIALGSGSPTRAICSTLIAQAFQSIHYPILPDLRSVTVAAEATGRESRLAAERRREIAHIRHYSLFTPRDFDISPYFLIVKPTLEEGFDFRQVPWARARRAADQALEALPPAPISSS